MSTEERLASLETESEHRAKELSKMETAVAELKGTTSRLKNTAWILGTLAAIFGAAGAFGFKAFTEANAALETLRVQVADLQDRTGEVTDFLDHEREKHEKAFSEYVEGNKANLVSAVAGEVAAVCVQYDSNIEIYNATAPHLNIDVHWPSGQSEPPRDTERVQVHTDLSNKSQTWRIRRQ